MMKAVEGAAEDQEGPFLADQLDRGRNRARQRGLPERIEAGRQTLSAVMRRYLPIASHQSTSHAKNSCELKLITLSVANRNYNRRMCDASGHYRLPLVAALPASAAAASYSAKLGQADHRALHRARHHLELRPRRLPGRNRGKPPAGAVPVARQARGPGRWLHRRWPRPSPPAISTVAMRRPNAPRRRRSPPQ